MKLLSFFRTDLLHFHFHPGFTVANAAQTDGKGPHSGHLIVPHGHLGILQQGLPLGVREAAPAKDAPRVWGIPRAGGRRDAVLGVELAPSRLAMQELALVDLVFLQEQRPVL